MTLAICYKCGSKKTYAVSMCPACKTAPNEDDALSTSWLLTDNMHSVDQLAKFADAIKAQKKLCFDPEMEQKARTIVSNMRSKAKSSSAPSSVSPPRVADPPTTKTENTTPSTLKHTSQAELPSQLIPTELTSTESNKVKTSVNQQAPTSLHLTAFQILGVSTRDDRRRIVELAEEKSLLLDGETCSKARSDLTNPRTRLCVELSWLPGISPRRAAELMNVLQTNTDQLIKVSELPALAHANLLAASLELLDPSLDVAVWVEWIMKLAVAVESINLEVVMRDINEDRQVSGFPEIKSINIIEAELSERRGQYRAAIKAVLNKLQTVKLVNVVTEVVERATQSGTKHAPLLVDEIVNDYEVGFHGYMQKEAEAIYALVDGVRNAAPKGVEVVKPLVNRIDEVVRKWDRVAQPIHLSMKSRGLEHDLSSDIAYRLRSLGYDLYKENDMIEMSEKLTLTSREVFAELSEVRQKLDEDSAFISFQKEAANIETLLENARAAAPDGEDAVAPFIDSIEEAVEKWKSMVPEMDRRTDSSNLSAKFSRELAFNIRSFGIELFNEHGMLEMADRLTKLLQEAFEEIPEVSERLQEDASAIEDILKNRKQSDEERIKWERDITYRADLGMIFKDALEISPVGIVWKDKVYSLDSITRVRWGGVKESVNGIPTGTSYTIAFGDNNSEAIVTLRKSDVYEQFIEKLWRAVCVRLMTQLAKGLKAGNSYDFGDAVIDDAGVKLTKHKFITDETVYCSWGKAHIYSSNGSFFIQDSEDKKTYSSMSYIHTPNVHVLESLIRLSFKNWKGKISGLLDG